MPERVLSIEFHRTQGYNDDEFWVLDGLRLLGTGPTITAALEDAGFTPETANAALEQLDITLKV